MANIQYQGKGAVVKQPSFMNPSKKTFSFYRQGAMICRVDEETGETRLFSPVDILNRVADMHNNLNRLSTNAKMKLGDIYHSQRKFINEILDHVVEPAIIEGNPITSSMSVSQALNYEKKLKEHILNRTKKAAANVQRGSFEELERMRRRKSSIILS